MSIKKNKFVNGPFLGSMTLFFGTIGLVILFFYINKLKILPDTFLFSFILPFVVFAAFIVFVFRFFKRINMPLVEKDVKHLDFYQ